MKLPETDMTIKDLPLPMTTGRWDTERDLKCQCGSGLIASNGQYMACGNCRRVWPVETITILSPGRVSV